MIFGSIGMNQDDVGANLQKYFGDEFCPLAISQFEVLDLSYEEMCKLMPILQQWLVLAEKVYNDLNARRITAAPLLQELGRHLKKTTSIAPSASVELEKVFLQDPNPTVNKLYKIADNLSLKKAQVLAWFTSR